MDRKLTGPANRAVDDAAKTGGLRAASAAPKGLADLRNVGATLARYLGLPRAPSVTIAYVPWSGPSTPIVESMGIPTGHFSIARWAARGRYRRSIEVLEYEIVCAVGAWLDAHRATNGEGRGANADVGTRDALVAWYGSEAAAAMMAAREKEWRLTKMGIAIWLALMALGLVAARWL